MESLDKISLFMKASRFQVLPVMIIPVILGALAAFVWNGIFHPVLFLVTLLGAAAAHLFSNMINDLWDYRNGVDVTAKETASAISTNSGFLASGTLPMRTFRLLTWGLFYIALICGIVLSLISGWQVLAISGLGALLAYFYVAPPIKFGYRGKGFSEIAILLSFGVLPVMGSYFVQTSGFDYRPLMLSLPIGLLTTLILFNHHFLHWEADRAAGKRTLVVVWGERNALLFSRFLSLLAYVTLLACIMTHILPLYTILALITAVPLYRAYRTLQNENAPTAYLPLMGASLKAAVNCGFIMIVCLVVQGLINSFS